MVSQKGQPSPLICMTSFMSATFGRRDSNGGSMSAFCSVPVNTFKAVLDTFKGLDSAPWKIHIFFHSVIEKIPISEFTVTIAINLPGRVEKGTVQQLLGRRTTGCSRPDYFWPRWKTELQLWAPARIRLKRQF